MKKVIAEWTAKKKELETLETRREDLLKEQRAIEAKLTEAKKVLFNSELDEVALLRKVWSARKVEDVQRQFEDEEPGRAANDCAPLFHGEGLGLLRAEIDAALRGVYPTDAVEKMRNKVEELRRSAKSLEVLFNKQLPGEIETLEGQIAVIKTKLARIERHVCQCAFDAVKADVRKIAWPLIKEAFVTVNLLNPYFLRWADARFFYMLFCDIDFPMKELLSEREKLRAEIFKEGISRGTTGAG